MRIGALAALAELTTKTIRFYEQAGLLPEPNRTPAGYREYGPQAADRLAFIRDARAADLRQARTALRRLRRRAAGTDPAECADGDICTILRP